MEGRLVRSHSSNSTPTLISRLDRLDSIMENLEGKTKTCSSKGGAITRLGVVNKECMPLGLAVKEAQSKGSLLDRIKSLEDRLVELYLDIETEGASPSKTSQVEQNEISPSYISRKGFSNSFSKFRRSYCNYNNKKQTISQLYMDKFPLTEENEQQPKIELGSEASQEKKSSKKIKDEKTSQKQKKMVSNLLHMRIFGC